MVFRIRDLLYEEKFTIAGAKKKLLDDARSGHTSKPKPAAEQLSMESALSVEAKPPAVNPTTDSAPSTAAQPATPSHSSEAGKSAKSSDDQSVSPHIKRVLRLIKHDLEDLLTTLNSDASIDSRSK